MGVERSVTRWYIQRQLILDEIATIEAKLNTTQLGKQRPIVGDTTQADDESSQQLAEAQEKLLILGPCPKPMMG